MTIADIIRPHVDAINEDADAGNVLALQIIKLYGLHAACPNDPGASGLCKAAFDAWLNEKEKESL